MTMEIFLQTVLVIISVCAAIYGMMNSMLKDIYTKLNLIDSHISEIKEDQKKMDQRVMETNKRMDGVYNVLLEITENLKG